jgi:hypothetical protein
MNILCRLFGHKFYDFFGFKSEWKRDGSVCCLRKSCYVSELDLRKQIKGNETK